MFFSRVVGVAAASAFGSRSGRADGTDESGVFQYTLTNSPQVNYASPPPLVVGTSYALRLHFAEITPGITQAGQRQFNVAVNGVPYLMNFDIVAEAGGAQKAVVKTYTVTPNASGQIVIWFTAGAAGLPKVSALELFSVAPVTSGTTSVSANVVYQIASGATAAQGSYSADRFYNGGGPAPSSRTINVRKLPVYCPGLSQQTRHRIQF